MNIKFWESHMFWTLVMRIIGVLFIVFSLSKWSIFLYDEQDLMYEEGVPNKCYKDGSGDTMTLKCKINNHEFALRSAKNEKLFYAAIKNHQYIKIGYLQDVVLDGTKDIITFDIDSTPYLSFVDAQIEALFMGMFSFLMGLSFLYWSGLRLFRKSFSQISNMLKNRNYIVKNVYKVDFYINEGFRIPWIFYVMTMALLLFGVYVYFMGYEILFWIIVPFSVYINVYMLLFKLYGEKQPLYSINISGIYCYHPLHNFSYISWDEVEYIQKDGLLFYILTSRRLNILLRGSNPIIIFLRLISLSNLSIFSRKPFFMINGAILHTWNKDIMDTTMIQELEKYTTVKETLYDL